MIAIEFKADVKGGSIEIPAEYHGKLHDTVRVIILTEGDANAATYIDELLKTPLKTRDFEPLPRDAIYG